MGYTKVEGDHLDLSGRKYQNDTYDKINRILDKCSDTTVEYIYQIINCSFTFFKRNDLKK